MIVDRGLASEKLARVDATYIQPGERVGEVKGLPPTDERVVEIRLADRDGGTLDSARVYLEHVKDLLLTISITRDCMGVSCSFGGDTPERCLAGRCVDARCAKGDEAFCTTVDTKPIAECEGDSDCIPESTCANRSLRRLLMFRRRAKLRLPSRRALRSCRGRMRFRAEKFALRFLIACAHIHALRLNVLTAFAYIQTKRLGTPCDGANECLKGVCGPPVSCSDGEANQDETDIDCGGAVCPGCANQKSCLLSSDCSSGYCAADSRCRLATCNDGIKNGNESAIDCGGSDCSGCHAGNECTEDNDCAGAMCLGMVCQEPSTCADGQQNAEETGVDCGGQCLRECVVYDCVAQTDIPAAECLALKNLYDATGGKDWAVATDWFSDVNPCSWTALTCSAGRLTEILLDDESITGRLPQDLDSLSQLRVLEIGVTEIGKSTSLTGPIPPTLGNLTNLQTLALRHNPLTGSIPIELGSLSNLTDLLLDYGTLSGTIPKELGGLQSLTRLWLHDTDISGMIPGRARTANCTGNADAFSHVHERSLALRNR